MEEINVTTAETAVQPTDENVLTFELNDTLEKVVKGKFHGKKIPLTHELSRASLADLQKRDSKQAYRSQEVEEKVDQVLTDLSGTTDIELYNKLIVSTNGYALNVSKEQSADERSAALNGIPAQHKIQLIQDLTKVSSEVIYDETDEEITEFVWSEGQTYRVRSELGGNGEFVIYSQVKEPSYRQFELYSGATKFYIEHPKGSTKKPITRISMDLTAAVKLFDELVESIEGMTFNGNLVDVKDTKQLASIDAYFKRSVVTAVMEETKLDMGE